MLKIWIKLFRRIRIYLMPTEQELEVNRWLNDGGDEEFRYNFDLTSDSLVLDLGGFKGQWASDIFARYNCRIWIFEPVRSFEANISRRFQRNKKIEVFPMALGARTRTEIITVGYDGTSLFKKSFGVQEVIFFEDVVAFFQDREVDTIDLVKINIEGGEYELLPRLIESGIIMKIKQIQIQFHNYSPDSELMMKSIENDLLLTHRKTFDYKFVWSNWILRF